MILRINHTPEIKNEQRMYEMMARKLREPKPVEILYEEDKQRLVWVDGKRRRPFKSLPWKYKEYLYEEMKRTPEVTVKYRLKYEGYSLDEALEAFAMEKMGLVA
ncbi:hypothetical protein [Leptobacterium sp. I13]|uniref:hypothetical protein n=1 Tax=Leptobacterium meishanense TaxID=3128904 RepID=UPI0030ECC3E7